MLTKRELIMASTESSYDSDASPGDSDAILVQNLSANPAEGARMNERPATRSSLGALQHLYGGTLMSLSFDVELKGSGELGVEPEWGVLMKGCGLAETVDADTDVRYAPASSDHDSLTIYYNQDGVVYKLTGARGSVSVNLETGQAGMLSFNFTGHVTREDQDLPDPTFDDVVPPAVKGGDFTIGGYSAVISAFSFDLNNEVVTPPDLSAEDGYGEIRITGRDVSGSIDPEMTDLSTNDWLGDWESGESMSLDTGEIGSSEGNRIQITAPAVYYREPSFGERDGIRIAELSCGLAESDTDDEFEIVLT
ncbi:MAG: phage tail tube protein [Thiohalorhabdus sp.]